MSEVMEGGSNIKIDEEKFRERRRGGETASQRRHEGVLTYKVF